MNHSINSAGATCRRRLVSAGVALLGAFVGSTALAQSYPFYSVTALPISGFVAFNDQGLILGSGFLLCTGGGFCTQSDSPVLYDTRSGVTTGLTGTDGWMTQWGAINAAGQLAGTQIRRDVNNAIERRVVIRQPDGTLTPVTAPALPATLGSGLQARGLNSNGQIALQYTDGLDLLAPSCGSYLAWLGNGSWQALGSAGTLVSLSGLNAGGRAVGAAVPSATCGGSGAGYRAVASQANGTLIDLHGNLPGAFSRAFAINDLGYAVGEYDTDLRSAPDAYNPQGVAITHAVVWNTASLASFDLSPPDTLSRLNAANARGEVVGRATGPVSSAQPFAGAATVAVVGNLATSLPMEDLNELLADNSAGWVLNEALAINAGGQIVARGASAAGSGYALLTPLQTPADPYAVVPNAPAYLSATAASSTTVRLAWQNSARNATRLVVERCKGGSCTNFAVVATLPGDTAGWVNGGLSKRTAYRYRVRAGNAAGLSAPSNAVTVTTLR